MITSTLIESSSSPEVPFPCLMRTVHRAEPMVLLFSSDCTGTVVCVGLDEKTYFVGDHNSDWDMEQFTLYNGSVSLTNEYDIFVDDDIDGAADEETSTEFARIMASLVKSGVVTFVPAPGAANQAFGAKHG